jgi:hypothetical protein
MAAEFRHLRANLKELERSGNGEIADPIRSRMLELTNGIADSTAKNAAELALKASIALTWIEQSDVPGAVMASLYRDIVLMFPAER